jgi:hypothetical protein
MLLFGLVQLAILLCIYGACLMAAHNLVFREHHHRIDFPEAFKYAGIIVLITFGLTILLALLGMPEWVLWLAFLVVCVVVLKKGMGLFWHHAGIIAALFLVIMIVVGVLFAVIFPSGAA